MTQHYTSVYKSYLISLYWPVLHVQIPYLHRQVVSGHHVAPIVAKLDIWDWGYNLREEGTITGILWLLKYWTRKKKIKTNISEYSQTILLMGLWATVGFAHVRTTNKNNSDLTDLKLKSHFMPLAAQKTKQKRCGVKQFVWTKFLIRCQESHFTFFVYKYLNPLLTSKRDLS